MAYMVNGKGPYSDKAGEFYGNHHPGAFGTIVLPGDRETREHACERRDEFLARMRFGRPRPCKDASVRAENGWVGLYLKEDQPLFDWETPCETPPELLEPSL